MAIARTTMAALIAAIGFTAASNSAEAAGPHVDQLAAQLKNQAQELRTEFSIHFRQTAQYRHLISDSSLIYARAVRIQQVAHFTNNLSLLQRDLEETDRLFHHLEGLVQSVRMYGPHGHGGYATDRLVHIIRLMAEMEGTLHHLRQDLSPIGYGPQGPVAVPAPLPVPGHGVGYFPGPGGHGQWGGSHGGPHAGPGPGSSHSGISFGNGNVRFRIAF